MKVVIRSKGEVVGMLWMGLNEYGEVRIQQTTLTKSLEYLRDPMKDMANSPSSPEVSANSLDKLPNC